MRTHLRNIIAVIVLIAIVYVVTNYTGLLQKQLGLKGNTGKAQQIVGKIESDIGSEINAAEKQVMQMKVSDIFNDLSRFQRVPQDANSIKNYIQSELNNVLKSRDKKK